ncbi:DUF1631 family protein [Chitinimonas sp. PSY-7]|uniref:DUF1631 family protein n=1 Tax=Chitinimonas sp. PSY-7 TaxID=3459088 RepID=UPI0040403638
MKRAEILQALQATMHAYIQQQWPQLLSEVAAELMDQADRASSTHDARIMFDARATWLAFDTELRSAWLAHLQRLLERSLVTAFRREKRSFNQAPRHNLSLRDLAEIEQELALERRIANFRSAAGRTLTDLNARIANLYHQTESTERENPFRPYVICGSLALGISELDLLEDVSEVLQKAAAHCLSRRVIDLYQQLNTQLDSYGIPVKLPAQTSNKNEKKVSKPRRSPLLDAPSPTPVIPAGLAEQARQLPRTDLLMRWIQMKTSPDAVDLPPETSSPPYWLDTQVNAGQLLRELFGTFPAGRQNAPASFTTFAGSTVLAGSIAELELEATTQYSTESGESDASLRNRILENRGRLNSQAQDPSERMVVDVVAMLFEFMLRDGKVPGSVRSQLGRLQFQLLKLGLFDPSLFAEQRHPARQLFNRIGSIAVGLGEKDAIAMGLTAEIQRLIDIAVAAPSSDAALFNNLLSQLDHYLAGPLAEQDTHMARAAAAITEAEGRTTHYLQAVSAMRETLEGIDLPTRLRNFLLGTWPLVIEHVEREDANKAHQCRRIVPKLVWSVQPKTSNAERMQMLKALPELVNLLAGNLALARLSDTAQQDFMDWLVEAHVEALKEGHHDPSTSLADMETHFANYAQGMCTSCPTDCTEYDTHFIAEAAAEFDESLELLDQQFSELVEDDDEAAIDLAESDELKEKVLKQLRTGVVVEIAFGGSSRRARLNWISPNAACLLLTISDLGKPAALSVQLFRRLLALDHVRFIESEPLFERAVIALLRNVDEMEQWSEQANLT